MSDIALKLFGGDGAPVTLFDVLLNGAGDLQSDAGLETAVILSLFLDRRALTSDTLPDATDDRRGWWADVLGASGDRIGSRLWLISRATLPNPQTLGQARAYAEEALAWMVEDGVARRVIATATRLAANRLGLAIEIHRGDGTKWQKLWQLDLS